MKIIFASVGKAEELTGNGHPVLGRMDSMATELETEVCMRCEGVESRRHTAVHRGRVQSGDGGVNSSIPKKENARKGQKESGPQLSKISEKALDKGKRPKVIEGVI